MVIRRRAAGSPEADQAGEEEPEEVMQGPVGRPVTYEPPRPKVLEIEDEKKETDTEETKKELEPLFTSEQVKQFEEMQRRAPMLYGSPQMIQGGPENEARGSGLALEDGQVERPTFLPAERPPSLMMDPQMVYQQQMMQYFFMLQQENAQLKMEQEQLRVEQEALKERLKEKEERRVFEASQQEGEASRKAKQEMEGFQTPDSQQQGVRTADDQGGKSKDDLESERRRLYDLTPMEQYDELQKMMDAAVGSANKPPPGRDLRGPLGPHRPLEGARSEERQVPKKEVREKGTGGDAGRGQGTMVGTAEEGRMQRQVDVLSKMMLHLLERWMMERRWRLSNLG